MLQKLLITRLVKQNGLTYSELTKGYDFEDNIVFHLKQLTSKSYIEKRDDRYYLTPEGVTTLNTFQKTDLQDNPFKMAFFGFVCSFGDSYLVKPHNNDKGTFYNLPSGSPLFGESAEDALERIFYEETDINLGKDKFKFDSIHLKTVKTNEGKILFDDAFIVYKIEVTDVQKNNMNMKKGSIWLPKKEIRTLDNKWPEIDMCILKGEWEIYSVYDVVCDYID